MKAIVITLIISLSAIVHLVAQIESPKDGALISAEKSTVTLAVGSKSDMEVRIVRSKKYSKSKFGGIKANAPKGIVIVLSQNLSNPDLYTMNLIVANEVTPKKYNLILNGTGKNAHKVRGLVISIVVVNDQVATTDQ